MRALRALLRLVVAWALALTGARAAAPEPAPEPEEILIAVADRGGSLGPAGSTPRGAYRRAGGYGAGTWAQHVLGELARQHALEPGEDWRIAALDLHCQRLRLLPGQDREAVLAQLARDPRVALAQPLQRFEGQGALFNDPYYPLQTHLKAIGADSAQRLSQGAGVRVALIDSGVDATHPDLQGRLLPPRDLVGSARPPQPGGDRHGTQVAGVIAAAANNGQGGVGVAPEAQLLPLRGCWEADGKAQCDSFTLARALAAALQDGAPIVNLSLAGPRDPLLERLVEALLKRGVSVVGAVPRGAAADGFPAAVPGVLAVRALDDPALAPGALGAPGRDVLTLLPGGGYDFAQGASLATAQVSGLLALLRARDPAAGADRLRAALSQGQPLACQAMRHLQPGLDCNR